MIQTTEGYLAEVHDMLNRMVELSEKSANGTYENAKDAKTGETLGPNDGKIGNAGTDRDALQSEMDQLCAEIDRIAATANFNNVKLFNGTLSTKSYDSISSLKGTETKFSNDTGIVTALGTGATRDNVTVDSGFELEGTLKADWDDTNSVTFSLEDKGGNVIASQTIAGPEADTQYTLEGKLTGIKIKTGTALGTDGTIGTIGKSDVLREVDLSESGIAPTGITAIKGLGVEAEGKSIAVIQSNDGKDISVVVGDKNYVATGVTAASTTEVTKDIELTDALSGEKITITIDTTTRANDIKTGTVVLGADIEAGVARTTSKNAGDGLTLQIGETSNAADKLTVGVDRLHTDTLFAGITGYSNDDGNSDVRLAVNDANTVKGTTGYTIDISGQQRASAAAEAIRGVINKVSTQRAALGAMQNRLDYTVNNLNTASENVTAANSRIRDTDMAKEMTKYTQMNVLAQAAQAMLAQANLQPQSVLQLLG
jgi:flagellin